MKPITSYKNYIGQIKPVKKPRPVLVAIAGDGDIFWSRSKKGNVHTVQYGLQIKDFRGPMAEVKAAEDFSSNVLHFSASNLE